MSINKVIVPFVHHKQQVYTLSKIITLINLLPSLIKAVTSHLVPLLAGVNFGLLENILMGKRVNVMGQKKEHLGEKSHIILKQEMFITVGCIFTF